MFVVSKDGYSVREPKRISMSVKYSKEVENEAQKIYDSVIRDNMSNKLYAPNEIEGFARKQANEYVRGRGVCSIILDGEFDYGDYDEVRGKIAFEKILTALKNGERFFDMREVEFGEDRENAN